MKNFFKLATIGLSSLMLTGCFNLSTSDANEEVVLVAKPWLFGNILPGHEGIYEEPLTNGSTWVAWSTSEYPYIMTPISYTEPFADIISSDNVPMDISATAVISIVRGNSPELHQKFGRHWYANKVQKHFNMLVRNFVRSQKHKSLMNDRTTIEEGQKKLFSELTSYITTQGLPILLEGVILEQATPPEQVINQISETAAQKERALTEAERKNAEEAREGAEAARAIADKAYQNKMGFSPQEFLYSRSLEIEKEKLEIVKDKDDVKVIMNSGSSAQPILSVKP